jgi:citrate lyase subunit beta / citryl-CoA lyase
MTRDWPIWRSMLFVPAHVEKFVASAHTRDADAYILDLEDSVPAAQKALARTGLARAAQQVLGAAVIVRTNADEPLRAADLEAAVMPGVAALMLPKIGDAATLRHIGGMVAQFERARGLAEGSVRLIGQIEDVHALARVDEIATSSPRLMGLILGSEDFSVSAGAEPATDTLFAPNQQMLFACRRAGILPFGFPGSIAVFRDLDAFRQTIRLARRMGFVGSYAIHPDQVRVMNEEFVPPTEDVAWARELLAANEQAEAQGRGAFEFRGKMVDAPVVARARETVRRAR